MITTQTTFRNSLAVPFDRWQSVVSAAGGPAELSARPSYDAAGDLSGLCLAMLGQESGYGTQFGANPKSNANPLNLRPRGGDGFLRLSSYASGIAEWRDRITSPTYAYAGAQSIAELIAIYAPKSDANDPIAYAAAVVARLNQWGVVPGGSPTVSDVVFGRVPKPPIVELICSKIGPGHGYYELGHPRQNVGVCEHITDGYGSIEFYHAFFSIGGEREADALVDFVVGRDGRIGMLNDWRGSRAPYANGNTAGVEGDGGAFLAHYAGELDPPNFHLVSIEHEGKAADDWTGPQWNASVALDAWLFDQMGVRYDSFPVNQAIGIVTHLFHSEFTDKGGNALDECPGRYIKQHIGQFQAEVKALMMAHQVAATPQPVPHPAVPVPTIPWGRDATGRQKLGDADCYAFLGQVTALRDVDIRATASRAGTVIGSLKKGQTGTIRGAFHNKVGRWALIDLGAHGVGRAPLSAFEERWPTP